MSHWEITTLEMPDGTNTIEVGFLTVHAAVLATGKMLFFGGNQFGYTGGVGADKNWSVLLDIKDLRLSSRILGLKRGAFNSFGDVDSDVFCAGHAFMEDGSLLVAGGSHPVTAATELPKENSHRTAGHLPGSRDSWIFMLTPSSGARKIIPWKRTGLLNLNPNIPIARPTEQDIIFSNANVSPSHAPEPGGRWYPTLITLQDGSVFCVGGHPEGRHLDEHSNTLVEVFNPGENRWLCIGYFDKLFGGRVWIDPAAAANHALGLSAAGSGQLNYPYSYPRMFLLPGGFIFIATPTGDAPDEPLPPFANNGLQSWIRKPATKTRTLLRRITDTMVTTETSVIPDDAPNWKAIADWQHPGAIPTPPDLSTPGDLQRFIDSFNATFTGGYRDYRGTAALCPMLPEEKYRARILLLGMEKDLEMVFTEADIKALRQNFQNFPMKIWKEIPGRKLAPGRTNKDRNHGIATILPNGNIFLSGGIERSRGDFLQVVTDANGQETVDYGSLIARPADISPDTNAVLHPDLFNPFTNTWQQLEPATVVRNYHSIALLLPDGSVMTGGSNLDAQSSLNSSKPNAEGRERRLERYYPAYFRFVRPQLRHPSPEKVWPDIPNYAYKQYIKIAYQAEEPISAVVMVRCGSVTHGFDADQRLVGLEFRPPADSRFVQGIIEAQMPPDGSIAPPGPYMLFVLTGDFRKGQGVPSHGAFCLLQGPSPPVEEFQ